jgi:hypothetical protein
VTLMADCELFLTVHFGKSQQKTKRFSLFTKWLPLAILDIFHVRVCSAILVSIKLSFISLFGYCDFVLKRVDTISPFFSLVKYVL